jgi:hypothetical protein
LTIEHEEYRFFDKVADNNPILLIALLRVRNEALILKDTLEHLSMFCDYIVAYDDASTDETFLLLRDHPQVIAIKRNLKWNTEIEKRLDDETKHRRDLLSIAKEFKPKWIFCADADERYIGNIREFVSTPESDHIDIVRISLFDAYMTVNDFLPYDGKRTLLNFRKYFGIERRDIVILWKNLPDIEFHGIDKREPLYKNKVEIVKFFCQHYGKSLSIEHWEETCDYYCKYFPWESYGRKWSERKGKGLHCYSDFGTPLYKWGSELFNNAMKIH